MSDVQLLDLQLAPEVKEVMKTFLSQINRFQPTLVLLKDALDKRWKFGAYGPDELAGLERAGLPYLYLADGFTFAIPAATDVSELEGRTFHLNAHGLVLRGRG